MRARSLVLSVAVVLVACGGDDAAVVSKKKGAGGASGASGRGGQAQGGTQASSGGTSGTGGAAGSTAVGGAGGSGSASVACPGAAPKTAAEHAACLAELVCGAYASCCGSSAIEDPCERLYRGLIDEPVSGFDAAASATCLAEMAKRPPPSDCVSFEDEGLPAACRSVQHGAGGKKLGEKCRTDEDCGAVAGGARCNEWSHTEADGEKHGRVCQTTVVSALGGPCDDGDAFPPVGTAHDCGPGAKCENRLCVADSGGGGSTTSPSCTLLPYTQHPFLVALSDAVCTKAVGCCQTANRTVDGDRCRSLFAFSYPLLSAFGGFPLPPADGRAADPAMQTACIDALKNAPGACTTPLGTLNAFGVVLPPDVPGPCDKLFVSPTAAAPGGACTDRWDCAVPATGAAACVKNVCVAYVPVGLGETCVSPTPFGGGDDPPAPEVRVCASSKGLTCGPEKKCVAVTPSAENGATCTAGIDCKSGRCVATKCAATLPLGAACTTDGDCERGECVDGTCDLTSRSAGTELAAGLCQ